MVSEPRLVVIDDTDSRMQYSGSGWFQDQGSQDNVGDLGPPYESTLHGTQSNASLSFSFSGSRVIVIGSYILRNDSESGVVDPTWQCLVDGLSIGPTTFQFPSQGNNEVLCEQDNLVDGPHLITVNVAVITQQTFWFDQIRYAPSASVPLDKEAILVDNSDPALQFGDGWTPLWWIANMTTVANSNFTFSFVGESLSWYAFIPTALPHAPATGSYSVDGGAAVNFLLKGLPPNGTTDLYNQKFFQTPSYPAGPHTIVVTFLGNSSTTPLGLDYLIVQNGTFTSTTSAGAPSSTRTNTIDSSNASSSSHSTNIGPIIGGVVGGLVLVAVAILAFIFSRREEKRQPAASRSGGKGPDVEPFYSALSLQPSGTAFGYTPQQPSQSSRTSKTTQYGLQPITPTTTDFNPVVTSISSPRKMRLEGEAAASTLRSQRTSSTPPQSTNTASGSQRIIHHEDSGVRLLSDRSDEETVEIPPMYTPG